MGYELIGYLAGIVITIQLFPQLYKSWKTRSTKDLSTYWLLTYILGVVLWGIYGYGIESLPLIISATVETLFALVLLGLKLKYS